jgi:PAS domain S-box-containing protein
MPRSTTNPVVVYDDSGRIIDANEPAASLVGTPLPQLRDMHVRDFFHPDDLPMLEERLRTMRPGDEVRIERWLRCCDGRYRRVRAKVKKRTIGGYRAEYEPITNDAVDLPERLTRETL